MMNREFLRKDNKGASLILVIVAMLFVGVIASIVLTLTVGNSNSIKATKDTSKNFYTSESVLDELKMYLKKLASNAATEAYGQAMEASGGEETVFAEAFKEKLSQILQDEFIKYSVSMTEDGKQKHILNTDFINGEISYSIEGFERLGQIRISYEDFISNVTLEGGETNTNSPVLKGVVISYTDERGYETSLTTDITFNSNYISLSRKAKLPGQFTYDIDHFIILSGGDVNPRSKTGDIYGAPGLISGTMTGNIYARREINVHSGTDSKSILKTQYIIAGGDIYVDGKLDIAPVDNTSIIGNEVNIDGTNQQKNQNPNASVWIDSFMINGDNSEVNTASGTAGETNIFLNGNLELNGTGSSYTAVGGGLYGYSFGDDVYSYDNTNKIWNISSGTASSINISEGYRPHSSAIILNDLSARLNLSQLEVLKIAGKAYTALPNLDGTGSYYKYFKSGSTERDIPTDLSYFTQGESITYRSLQALYLVPGDCIKGIGHNPMKKSEFESICTQDSNGNYIIKSASIKTQLAEYGVDFSSYISSGEPVVSHFVRYMSGSANTDTYVYLFWNFDSQDDAVDYFKSIENNERFAALVSKQIGMAGSNGRLLLPSGEDSTIQTEGNYITYNGSAHAVGPTTANKVNNVGTFADTYETLKSSASEDGSKTEGADIIDNLFSMMDSGYYNEKYDSLDHGTLKLVPMFEGTEKIEGGSDEGTTEGTTETTTESTTDTTTEGTTETTTEGSGDETNSETTEEVVNTTPIKYVYDYKNNENDREYRLITGPNICFGTTTAEATNGENWYKVDYDPDYRYIVITPGDVYIGQGTGASTKFVGIVIAGGNVSFADNLNMECLGMVTRDVAKTYPEDSSKNLNYTETISEFKALLMTPHDDVDDNTPISRLRKIFKVDLINGRIGNNNSSDGDLVTLQTSEWKRN